MLRLFGALSAVLALVMIALVSALITMRLAIHGAEVRVPSLSGMTLPDAATQLHAHGLETGIDGHFYSNTQAAGHVLTQSPPPGTLVRKSWRVRVTVSLGPQKVAIPSVNDMDESIATITIRRTGLKVGDIAAMPYAYAPENTVVAQTPVAHATDIQGPRVGILAALAPLPPQDASVMPDLTGEPFTAAALTVVHAGFTLAPLQNPASPLPAVTAGSTTIAALPGAPPTPSTPPSPQAAVPSGIVIAQIPTAGSRIVAGATIQLTVQP
ncbi:MAG: PASTA domain-containing protein [Acidobacteriaceae bacterium]